MAHCLVKRLYGRTNKHDATAQIGRHVRRLEHAQHATAEQNKLNISEFLNESMGQDLDVHHLISKSQNDPLNIYLYVHANQGDPTFMVRCTFEYCILCFELINISDSFPN